MNWNSKANPQPSNWNTRDSSGRKGLDETPQSVARGGSLAARGKRVYSSCGSRREYFDATSFENIQLLSEIWIELLKRSTSRGASIQIGLNINQKTLCLNMYKVFYIK